MKISTQLNASMFLEMDFMLIGLLFFVIFAFGWCIIGFSLLNELSLYITDKYFERKNILLVIAHPDDESMFFSPLLSYLSHKQFSDKTHILCLSNGGNDKRSKELQSSATKVFGIRKKNITIIDDTLNLKDNIKLYWNNDIIIQYMNEYIEQHNIDIILTFDKYGISGHPNHISIYNALQMAINKRILFGYIERNMDIYALKSVSIIRKYCGWIEAMLWLIVFVPLNLNINKSDFVILSAPNKCWDGMTHHVSQFVWFRKLFVVFSRYSWINQFHKILPQQQHNQNNNQNKKRR
eukprot:169905_1